MRSAWECLHVGHDDRQRGEEVHGDAEALHAACIRPGAWGAHLDLSVVEGLWGPVVVDKLVLGLEHHVAERAHLVLRDGDGLVE